MKITNSRVKQKRTDNYNFGKSICIQVMTGEIINVSDFIPNTL